MKICRFYNVDVAFADGRVIHVPIYASSIADAIEKAIDAYNLPFGDPWSTVVRAWSNQRD